jgi:hypothetical protein
VHRDHRIEGMDDEATCDTCVYRMQEQKLYNYKKQTKNTRQA